MKDVKLFNSCKKGDKSKEKNEKTKPQEEKKGEKKTEMKEQPQISSITEQDHERRRKKHERRKYKRITTHSTKDCETKLFLNQLLRSLRQNYQLGKPFWRDFDDDTFIEKDTEFIYNALHPSRNLSLSLYDHPMLATSDVDYLLDSMDLNAYSKICENTVSVTEEIEVMQGILDAIDRDELDWGTLHSMLETKGEFEAFVQQRARDSRLRQLSEELDRRSHARRELKKLQAKPEGILGDQRDCEHCLREFRRIARAARRKQRKHSSRRRRKHRSKSRRHGSRRRGESRSQSRRHRSKRRSKSRGRHKSKKKSKSRSSSRHTHRSRRKHRR